MSVSFFGTNGHTLDVNNGLASRLLSALNLPSNGTAGSADLSTAKERFKEARSKLSGEDLEYLDDLERQVDNLLKAGETTLEWS